MGLMLWLDRRGLVRRGRLFAVYILGYGLGRFWIELLRVDEASLLLGLRVNTWVSGALVVGGLVWLLWPARSPDDAGDGAEDPASGPDEDVTDAVVDGGTAEGDVAEVE
jgi:prolipoprotein diacylglyceryltransferase